MIPLLPLLLLRPDPSGPETPAWVAAVLRETPPPPPLPPLPRVIGSARWTPRTEAYDGPAEPSAYDVMRDHVDALLARGDGEAAYRAADAFPWDSPRWVHVPLVHAQLLTGRGAEAQAALVTSLQLNPLVDRGDGRWRVSGGLPSDAYLLLSVATAMRGRVYPGQGAYVLDELRSLLRANHIADPQVEGMDAPTTPEGVLFLSVLKLGEMGAGPDLAVLYLEWALRLEPACLLAGDELEDYYYYRHRDADAARVAAGMVQSLPPSPARDRFAKRLKEVHARMVTAAKPKSP